MPTTPTGGQMQSPQSGMSPMAMATTPMAGTTGTMPSTGGAGTTGMLPAAGQAGATGMTPMGDAGGAVTDAGTASDAGTSDDAATGGGTLGGPLMYTGTLTMGATVPARHKCMSPFGGGTSGENVSPPLAWSGGPAETLSFAVVLYDTRYGMLHWVIWDIPPTTSALPEGLASGYALSDPAGAHQVANMGSDDHAYAGPCSSAGALAGTYEFRLYALDTAMLALTESSSGAQAQAAVEAAMLEMTVWTATPE
jgi:Raf kinase inhibitor-like YbhB/YbcL family protein